MKTSKLALLWALTFITGAVVGGTCMGIFLQRTARTQVSCGAAQNGPDEWHLMQLEQASLPADVREVTPDNSPKSAADIPSQLVRSALPADVDVSLSGAAATTKTEEIPAGIVLSSAQDTLVLNAKKPVQQASDGSSITMIEAPVSVKRIQTVDAYKAFKTKARGSYPTADFASEEVIVLESASNLPDNVFEIVEIVPSAENVKVMYRVNVFGLDKKTNTHSAQKIRKTSLPIIVSQVL